MSYPRTNMPGAYLNAQSAARRVEGRKPEITGYPARHWKLYTR